MYLINNKRKHYFMSTEKKYRLLKDLPDSKVGDEYIWNNSMEAYYKNGNVQDSYWNGEAIENNPEWFEEVIPNKQRVNGWYLVMDDRKIWYPCKFTDGYWWLNPDFPKVNDTFFRNINEIKQPTPTTASVLNNDADTVVEDSLPKNIEAEYYKTLKELETTEWLLEERQKILDAIPECEVHGKCVPHALDWVEIKKSKIYSKLEVDTIREEAGLHYFREGYKYLRATDDKIVPYDELAEMTVVGAYNQLRKKESGLKPSPTEDKGKVLFTTEDGAEIENGGNCWVLDTEDDSIFQWINVCKEGMQSSYKLFSTKEAAEQYIIYNKPCLSLNDVYHELKMICDGTFGSIDRWNFVLSSDETPEYFYKRLVKKAKQKLNQ